MRIAVVGGSVLAVLVAVAMAGMAAGPSLGLPQTAVSAATGGRGLVTLATLATPAGEHRQQVTVIEPETCAMAVYHIDTASGEIVLKSVRNIHYDLKMIEFNGTSPLPREIRGLLEQR